jgi:hypothetical protein
MLIARLVAIYSGNEPALSAGAPERAPAGDTR